MSGRGPTRVKDVSAQNFGYLIAFVLPGFLIVLAVAQVSPVVEQWLETAPQAGATAPTVGGFLYVTLASVAAGIVASTLRWLVIDSMHHATGILRPAWNDAGLQEKLEAFEALVSAHYRWYQHYANSLVSLGVFAFARHATGAALAPDRIDVLCGGVALLYWFGSRDTLRRYYARTTQLLGERAPEFIHDQRTSSETSHPKHAEVDRDQGGQERRARPRTRWAGGRSTARFSQVVVLVRERVRKVRL